MGLHQQDHRTQSKTVVLMKNIIECRFDESASAVAIASCCKCYNLKGRDRGIEEYSVEENAPIGHTLPIGGSFDPSVHVLARLLPHNRNGDLEVPTCPKTSPQ